MQKKKEKEFPIEKVLKYKGESYERFKNRKISK